MSKRFSSIEEEKDIIAVDVKNTKVNKKREYENSRAERNKYWENLRKTKSAKSIVKLEKYSIRYDDDGNAITKYPWNQELPSRESERYFWELLQSTKGFMNDKHIEKFCKERTVSDNDTDVSVLKSFIKYVLDAAEKLVEEKDKKREEDIKEVRRSVGFYEEEGIDEKKLEG